MSAPTSTVFTDAPATNANKASSVVGRLLRKPAALASIIFLLLVIVTAIVAPLLATHDPYASSAADVLAPPSADHWLGADGAGRDIYSRLLYAGQVSLLGAALAVVIAAVLGITLGLLAGYYSRWLENISNWVSSLLQALPGVVVLLAASAVLGPSIWTAMVIFGVLVSPAFYRVVFAAVSGVRNELYVDAARVSGLGDARIIGRHVLGVVRAPVIILAANVACIAIAVQAGLYFLGLGDSAVPSWGSMLNDGVARIYQTALPVLWPALMIGLTSIALVLLSNSLRDALERITPVRGRKPARVEATASVPVMATGSTAHTVEHGSASAEAPLLEVRDLLVGYDQADGSVTTVVNGVSLDVRRGEVHGLIGESGSGKTQTAWSVLGLLPTGGRITGGQILLRGTDVASMSARERRALLGKTLAYVPQEPMSNLDPSFTIGSQLVEPMRVKLGTSKAEASRHALDLLDRVGIVDPRRAFASYPHQLSGGMAQRVLIAGAISCEPDLLIADEPTTALDVTVQAEVLDLLRSLQREFDMGVILVTHNFGVVADICDRVSVMRSGQIVESGPTTAIFADPQHPYTQGLFDAILTESQSPEPWETTHADAERSQR
jgi:peptide/nickel transport system permease protein